jgi:hypothetical protein
MYWDPKGRTVEREEPSATLDLCFLNPAEHSSSAVVQVGASAVQAATLEGTSRKPLELEK